MSDAAIDFARFDALTFDCYGTLIDWETGILAGLRAVLGPRGRRGPTRSCSRLRPGRGRARGRAVSALSRGAGAGGGAPSPGLRRRARARRGGGVRRVGRRLAGVPRLGGRAARLHRRFRLGVITNCDDDLFAALQRRLGVDVRLDRDRAAGRRYKPNPRNFKLAWSGSASRASGSCTSPRACSTTTCRPEALGLATVWIDRRHGRPGRRDAARRTAGRTARSRTWRRSRRRRLGARRCAPASLRAERARIRLFFASCVDLGQAERLQQRRHVHAEAAAQALLEAVPAADRVVGRAAPRLDGALGRRLLLVGAAERHPVAVRLEHRVEVVDRAQRGSAAACRRPGRRSRAGRAPRRGTSCTRTCPGGVFRTHGSSLVPVPV